MDTSSSLNTQCLRQIYKKLWADSSFWKIADRGDTTVNVTIMNEPVVTGMAPDTISPSGLFHPAIKSRALEERATSALPEGDAS